MLSFASYITEKRVDLFWAANSYTKPTGATIPGLENPSVSEVIRIFKRSIENSVRFIVDSKGKMLAWDGFEKIHDQVAWGEGWSEPYIKGMIEIDMPPEISVHIWEGLDDENRTSRTDRIAKKNATLKQLLKLHQKMVP